MSNNILHSTGNCVWTCRTCAHLNKQLLAYVCLRMCAKIWCDLWETKCVQVYANILQSASTHTDLHPNDGAAPEVLISQLVWERESTRSGEPLKDTELNTNTLIHTPQNILHPYSAQLIINIECTRLTVTFKGKVHIKKMTFFIS